MEWCGQSSLLRRLLRREGAAATREVDAARHSAAISLFQLHFVKPGTIAVDLARVLPRAFEKRQNADYGDYAQASAEDVAALRDLVEDFVDACATSRRGRPGKGRGATAVICRRAHPVRTM